MIEIDTTLARDAETSVTRQGEVLLRLCLRVPPGSRGQMLEARAVKPFGSGFAAQYAARHQAAALRKGVRVLIRCAGMDIVRGKTHLHGLQLLRTPDIPPHRGVLPQEI